MKMNKERLCCPKNHGMARQLDSNGYCQDCQDYPYGMGKISP